MCTKSATTSSWGYEEGPWKGAGDTSAGGPLIFKKNFMQKFFFISIHKPPAWITFAPIKHTLAVTVEPSKFSSR